MLRDDIILDGEGLPLYRPGNGRSRAVQSTAIPALASETVQLADEPLVLDTFHFGMGYSQRLIPGTYSYGENVDARWPRLVLPGPEMNSVTLTGSTDHARCAFDDGTDLYIGAGRYVYKLAGGTGAPSQDRDLGASVSAYSATRFNGKGYVGTDAGGVPDLLHELDGAVWSTTGGLKRKHLTTVFWDLDYRLIGQDGASSITHVAADPMTAIDWAGSIPIGDSSYPINRLVASSDHVYIAKTNGLHDLDGTSGRSPNLTPQVGYLQDTLNGVAAVAMNGVVYMGHRAGLLGISVGSALDDGKVTNVQPGYGLPNESPIRGIVTASTAHGGWLVVAVYNGTDTYICYGRERHADELAVGPSPMLWHGGLIKLAGLQCYLLHLSGLTSPPRLWVGAGSVSAGYKVQYCILPRTEHPLQDSEYRFASTYSLYLAGQDWDHVATRKNLLQIDVEGDNLGLGATLTVNTNVEGGVFAEYGVAGTSPQSTLYPADEIIGRRIGLKLDGSGSSTSPAVVRGLLLRAAARVQTREIRSYQCLLAEMQSDRFRGLNGRDPGLIWDHLKRMEVGSQVTLRDELGDTLLVLVHAPVQRTEAEHVDTLADGKKTSRPIQLVTIQLSVLRRLGSGFLWDDGTHYDSGAVWT